MKRKSIILLVCLLVVALATSGIVFAKQTQEVVTINYNNIKITLDGKPIVPKDANGNTVEPFIMNGTTYLPVRAVASALGVEVDWDGTTKTVILTSEDFKAPVVLDPENSVGKTYASKSYNLTVDSLRTLTKYDEYTVAENGKEFVEILMTIENTSSESISVSTICFEGYLDGYAINSDGWATSTTGKLPLSGSIASGKKLQGIIVYQVPKGWKELEVQTKIDNNIFLNEVDMVLTFQNPLK